VSEQLTPLALRCRCDSLAGAGQAMHTLAHTQGGGPKAGFRLRWAAQNTTAGHQPAGRQHRGGVSLPSAQLEIQLWLQPPALVAALDQATGTSQPRLGAEACSYALLLTVRPAAAAAAATAACGHPHGAAAGFPRGHPGLRPTDPVSSDAHAVVEGEDCPERAKVGSAAAAAAAAAEQHTHRLWQYSFNLSGHSAGHRPGEDASSGGGGGGGGGARHAAAAAGRERLLLTPPLPAALLELARQQPLSVSMQLVLTLPPTALSSSSAAGAASAVPLQGRLIHVFVFTSSNISVSESRTCCNLYRLSRSGVLLRRQVAPGSTAVPELAQCFHFMFELELCLRKFLALQLMVPLRPKPLYQRCGCGGRWMLCIYSLAMYVHVVSYIYWMHMDLPRIFVRCSNSVLHARIYPTVAR
jgi:hypothetical protein